MRLVKMVINDSAISVIDRIEWKRVTRINWRNVWNLIRLRISFCFEMNGIRHQFQSFSHNENIVCAYNFLNLYDWFSIVKFDSGEKKNRLQNGLAFWQAKFTSFLGPKRMQIIIKNDTISGRWYCLANGSIIGIVILECVYYSYPMLMRYLSIKMFKDRGMYACISHMVEFNILSCTLAHICNKNMW